LNQTPYSVSESLTHWLLFICHHLQL